MLRQIKWGVKNGPIKKTFFENLIWVQKALINS